MTRGQAVVVVLAVLLSFCDGFDLQAMSFVAPAVGAEWSLDKATLGFVLASGLLGMAGGSLGLAPLADVWGRRPMVLAGLLLMTAGSLSAAASLVPWQLVASRVVTGVGIGLMVSMTTTLAAEFASERRRSFAVAATTVGFAVGGAASGLGSAAILARLNWAWVFVAGAAIGTLSLIITALFLPESPAFLVARRGIDALSRLNRSLAQLGLPARSELPPQPSAQRASYRALFEPGMAPVTIRLAVVYTLVLATAFFLLNWLPQMLVDAGFAVPDASLAAATAGLAGLAAGLIFGALAARLDPTRLAAIAILLFAASLAVFALAPPSPVFLRSAAATCGFFLSGASAAAVATWGCCWRPGSSCGRTKVAYSSLVW